MAGIAFPAAGCRASLRAAKRSSPASRGWCRRTALITSEDERRAFETDALTAYRRMPLAVVLPSSTEEVSAVLKFCNEHGVKVVPRGAGTSLAGGAIPQEDAIVLGVSKMNKVLDVNFADRTMRVQAGITNLAISAAVGHENFFYAPDPSSQLACTIAGNIAMNSGGAHCLKYGVTTNNLLGVRMVHARRRGRRHRRRRAWTRRATTCWGSSSGSEGQLGVVTEATVRILRAAEGARPVLFGFDTSELAGAVRGRHHRRGHRAGRHGVHGQAGHRDLRGLRPCRLSAGCRGAADHRGRGLGRRDGRHAWRRIVEIARAHGVKTVRESKSAMETAAIWKGRKSAFGATGPRRRLHLHGRHDPDRAAALRAARAWTRS